MKASKKLVGASVALAAALAVSVGTTYAWFTQQNYVEIQAIEAKVLTADTNLEVRQVDEYGVPVLPEGSADGATGFTYNLKLDLSKLITSTFELKDFTSKDSENGTTLYNRTNYDLANGEQAASAKAAAAADGFIEYFLEFRSDKAVDVQLLSADTGATSSVTSAANSKANGNVYAWKTIEENTYGTHETLGTTDLLATRAAYATRVGFVEMDRDTVDTNKSNAMTAKASGAVGVWHPNEAADATNSTNTGKGFWGGAGSKNLALDYEMAVKGLTVAPYATDAYTKKVEVNKTSLIKLEQVKSATEEPAPEIYTGIVRVRVWIEGRDGDCFNYILSDAINVLLSFKGVDTSKSS